MSELYQELSNTRIQSVWEVLELKFLRIREHPDEQRVSQNTLFLFFPSLNILTEIRCRANEFQSDLQEIFMFCIVI